MRYEVKSLLLVWSRSRNTHRTADLTDIRAISKSTHRRCSVKDVLENFAKFTGKHLWISLFLKKRLWHRCFSLNVAKFLRTIFSQNTSGRLLLSYFTFMTKSNHWNLTNNDFSKILKQFLFDVKHSDRIANYELNIISKLFCKRVTALVFPKFNL